VAQFPNIKFKPASKEDVQDIFLRLRTKDLEEAAASGIITPKESLEMSLKMSLYKISAFYDNQIFAMFGIVPTNLIGIKALIWMVGTDDINKIKFSFVKHTRRYVGLFLELYPVLENWVDERYLKAIKWLQICGAEFDFDNPVITPSGIKFYHFEIRRR
jgi:hypothetical protein